MAGWPAGLQKSTQASISKMRNEPLGPFAGVDRLYSAGLPNDTLGVQGTKVTLHDDESGSISAAVEKNLLHLGNDKANLVDRFDVRLLLDEAPGTVPVRPKSATSLADCELEEELDEERYRDLDQSQEGNANDGTAASPDAAAERNTSYQAVGLSYEGDPGAMQGTEATEFFDPGFDLPPEHRHTMVDMTQQQHKVMMQTAKFVRQEGGQLELVLRVRQAQNASFEFLKPDSPLHDYYCWLVHAKPQAGEMVTGPSVSLEESPAVAAAVQEQHEMVEAGGSLSHLVSMYGGSQDASHDDSDDEGTNPHGDTGQAAAPQTGDDPTLAPGAQRVGAAHEKESLVREEGLQPEKAAPAHGSAEQKEHGSRGAATTGNLDVAQQPAQSAQEAHHADLPPAESQGIISKLMAFVKKSGVKFEASIRKREKSKPRFGFLMPGHRYHDFYREQVLLTLGKEKAEELFASIPVKMPEAGLEQGAPAAVGAPEIAKPTSQVSDTQIGNKVTERGEAVQVTIRSNPSLAKIPFARRQTPLPKAVPAGIFDEAEDVLEPKWVLAARREAQDALGSEQASVARPELEEAMAEDPEAQRSAIDKARRNSSYSSSSSDDNNSRKNARDREDSSGISDALMEGDADEHAQRASAALAKAFDKGQGLEAALQAAAEADARKADEALKAERRRLAMQLLAARRSEAEKAMREERSAPKAQAIARHRLALLAEESSSEEEPEEEPEAGEITAPKPERLQPGTRMASLPKLEEVIRPPPAKQEPSSNDSSNSSRGGDKQRNGVSKGKSRKRESIPRAQRSQQEPMHRRVRSSDSALKKRKRRQKSLDPSDEESSDSSHMSDSPRRRRSRHKSERSRVHSSERDAKERKRQRRDRECSDDAISEGNERGAKKSKRRCRDADSSNEASSESDGRGRHKAVQKHRKHSKRTKEDSDIRNRHRQREEEDIRKKRHKRQRKDLDDRKFSNSALKTGRVSEKGHDWGNAQPKAKEKTAVLKAQEQKPTVTASEVPEALRAQIKAMLSR